MRTNGLSLAILALIFVGAGCGTTPESPQDTSVTLDLIPNCPAPNLLCGASCIDPMTDAKNCGACATACDSGYACTAGKCALSCAKGQVACDKECATLDNNPNHCGDCKKQCAAGQRCTGGKCANSCLAGESECPGGDGGTLCINLLTDGANCGGCGTACGPGTSCTLGQCTPTCAVGLAACSATLVGDAGSGMVTACVNLATDNVNCGSCGTTCPMGTACTGGACLGTCGAPLILCNGSCVDPRFDAAHCGSCGTPCMAAHATPACVMKVCGIFACSAGYSDCNGNYGDGCEVATQTDVANCGACGKACGAANNASAVQCATGACAVKTCAANFGDCDLNFANGCEATLLSDPLHCGSCPTDCTALAHVQSASCAVGNCTINACMAGYANCNNAVADGCEVPLMTDAMNCGTCGNVCNLGACTGGACPSVKVGNSAKDAGTFSLPANTIAAFPVTVTTAASVVRFGYFASAGGAHVTFGLYTDMNGPKTLLATTASVVVVGGGIRTEVPVVLPAALVPGTYWIAGVADAATPFFAGALATNYAVQNFAYAPLPGTYPGFVAFPQNLSVDVYFVTQ